jgi:PAS domain-containing protein
MEGGAALSSTAVRKRERSPAAGGAEDHRRALSTFESPSIVAETLLAWCESKDPTLLRDKMEAQSFTMVDMTTPGQPIKFASRAFVDMTGYRLDEIVGQNCRFLQGCAPPRILPRTVPRARRVQPGAHGCLCCTAGRADPRPIPR